MARKRMIDPSIWTDDGMAELTARQQLLFIGLFSNADDDGRLKGSSAYIRLILPTVYGGIGLDEVEADLGALLGAMRCLVSYEVAGRRYLAFPGYRKWQKIDHPYPSSLPPFPERSPNGSRALDERSGTIPAQYRLREEKLVEENVEEPGTHPAADAAPLKATPRPNRQAAVITAIQQADVPLAWTARDGKAIKDTNATPEKIAAAYVAAYRGEWGDDWLRDNLSVRLVVERLAGFEAKCERPRSPPKYGHLPPRIEADMDQVMEFRRQHGIDY